MGLRLVVLEQDATRSGEESGEHDHSPRGRSHPVASEPWIISLRGPRDQSGGSRVNARHRCYAQAKRATQPSRRQSSVSGKANPHDTGFGQAGPKRERLWGSAHSRTTEHAPIATRRTVRSYRSRKTNNRNVETSSTDPARSIAGRLLAGKSRWQDDPQSQGSLPGAPSGNRAKPCRTGKAG